MSDPNSDRLTPAPDLGEGYYRRECPVCKGKTIKSDRDIFGTEYFLKCECGTGEIVIFAPSSPVTQDGFRPRRIRTERPEYVPETTDPPREGTLIIEVPLMTIDSPPLEM